MRTKTSQCPSCQRKLNAATRVVGKGKPAPGAFTVCRCGSLLVFSRSLRVRLLSAEEFAKLPKEEVMALRKVQRAIEELRLTGPDC